MNNRFLFFLGSFFKSCNGERRGCGVLCYIPKPPPSLRSVDGIYRAMGEEKRDPIRPQFTDLCFTGDCPTYLTDVIGEHSSQLSLLAEAGRALDFRISVPGPFAWWRKTRVKGAETHNVITERVAMDFYAARGIESLSNRAFMNFVDFIDR